MPPVLVTGGTGTLGARVVRRLAEAGQDVRVLSRRAGRTEGTVEWAVGDLTTGAGIDAAVRGVASIVHCASDARAPRHDLVGTRTLIEAARRAGAPHLVYISIVGVDRVPLAYYRVKHDVERLVADSGLPWTILRATQFHDLVLAASRVLARMPVALVPAGTSFQPVDADEVAARLAELTLGPPAGRVPDFGGPQVATAADLVRAYLDATGRRRPVLPVRLPGRAARGFRAGGHLTPQHADGRRTYAEWLAQTVRNSSPG